MSLSVASCFAGKLDPCAGRTVFAANANKAQLKAREQRNAMVSERTQGIYRPDLGVENALDGGNGGRSRPGRHQLLLCSHLQSLP
eukprot:6172629-Pleurochrysis_carterae.AAC.4